MSPITCDVAVVGAGNAALCAALAAREGGADVVVLERAPEEERGGNSTFTGGVIRVAFDGVDDLKELFEISEAEERNTDFGTYTAADFFDDLARVTQYRTDPVLAEILVDNSFETLKWMRTKGVRFGPMYSRQAFEVNGRFKFWGGLAVEAIGGGPGLVENLFQAAEKAGIRILYQARATGLVRDDEGVHGVRVRHQGQTREIAAKAVVLAAGGFQANTEMRARYLGPGWELAKVRGTRFNTGDGLNMAFDAGAMSYGNWSGCHSVGWDMNAPPFGDLAVGDGFQKHSYPFGIMVNARGERFIDEGADFRNYTYAKYGAVILRQPFQFAWQVFDSKVTHLLRDEYRIRRMTKVEAETLDDLAGKLEGVDAERFLRTVKDYNDAVMTDVPFDPTVKDGRATRGLDVPKSNWATRIDEPPFEAYGTTCGITFTFGGLRIDGEARVIDTEEAPIPGLYGAGEIVGGLFYFNYPGGSGIMAGSVFGRIAGTSAAQAAKPTMAA
ncbi:MAG: FAD-dependent tricarballylate dehydrogenase TcuA [Rhodospirillales bacterium]|nr:FAD-dependent tricarballylate dehydrogenase TcuA [Rhodospirillales bacterium]MDP6882568.1 FAD-dependent tricarballylate dehydrogenase TcuA [Rhodospirillales bacterium]